MWNTDVSFEERSISLPAGKLSFFVGGSGPCVVPIHGAGGCKLSPAIRQLAVHFRLVAPIIPGFDGTEQSPQMETVRDVADIVAELIGRECDGRASVIGHSLGGHVASWLAVRHGARVRSLLLMCSAGFRKPGTRPTGDTSKLLYAHPERVPPASSADKWNATNQSIAARYRGESSMDTPLLDRLSEIHCPVLLVHGASDQLMPIESSQRIKSRLPQAEMVLIPDAGHVIDVDQPEIYLRVVRDFLIRTQKPETGSAVSSH